MKFFTLGENTYGVHFGCLCGRLEKKRVLLLRDISPPHEKTFSTQGSCIACGAEWEMIITYDGDGIKVLSVEVDNTVAK